MNSAIIVFCVIPVLCGYPVVATLVSTAEKTQPTLTMNIIPPERASATAKPLASSTAADVKLSPFTADMPGYGLTNWKPTSPSKASLTRACGSSLHVSFALSPDKKCQVQDLLEHNQPSAGGCLPAAEGAATAPVREQPDKLHSQAIQDLTPGRPAAITSDISQMRLLCQESDQQGCLFREMFYDKLKGARAPGEF